MRKFILIAIFSALPLASFVTADAQRRDYLTESEIELVRDAQELDLRVGVLTSAVDRRLRVLNDQPPGKENEKWGPMPKGSRLDLLSDVQKIIQKAVDDIDDVAARKKDEKIFPKAVWKLADACAGYAAEFKSLLDRATSDKERGSILTSTSLCRQVTEAAPQVPREPVKEKKKKDKSDN